MVDGLGGADVLQVGEQLERPRFRFDRNGHLHLDQPAVQPDQRGADGVEARVDPFAPQHLRHQSALGSVGRPEDRRVAVVGHVAA